MTTVLQASPAAFERHTLLGEEVFGPVTVVLDTTEEGDLIVPPPIWMAS